MPRTSTRTWSPAAYFRSPITWPKWSKATRRSKSSRPRPTTWCPATIHSCSRVIRRPKPASKAGWCASMWSRRAKSTASCLPQPRLRGATDQRALPAPSWRYWERTKSKSAISLVFADSCCKSQRPCATFRLCPAARVELVAQSNEGSSHGDGLDAISRQTAVGAAGGRAHRRPDCKNARRDAQRGDRPVKTFARDRLSVRYRQLEASERAQGAGSQNTRASAACRAAQGAPRPGARRDARRARRQGHVEGASSRRPVAANRSLFRDFPTGRLRKGQDLEAAVALLSAARSRVQRDHPSHDREFAVAAVGDQHAAGIMGDAKFGLHRRHH